MNNKFIQYSLFFKYIVKKLIYIPLNCIIFFFIHFDIIKRNLKFAENLQAVGNSIRFTNFTYVYVSTRVKRVKFMGILYTFTNADIYLSRKYIYKSVSIVK